MATFDSNFVLHNNAGARTRMQRYFVSEAQSELQPIISRPTKTANTKLDAFVISVLLSVVAFERAVFYYSGFYFLTAYHYDLKNCDSLHDYNITKQSFNVILYYQPISLMSYVLPVLGGLLGDGVCGRVDTTLLGSISYVIGTLLLHLLVYNVSDNNHNDFPV